MKSLVIAEKPSVARDIARVLHCNQKGNGILEGKEYVVTWALGHLVTLADPEEIGEMGYGDSADDAGEDETRGHPSDLQTISGS